MWSELSFWSVGVTCPSCLFPPPQPHPDPSPAWQHKSQKSPWPCSAVTKTLCYQPCVQLKSKTQPLWRQLILPRLSPAQQEWIEGRIVTSSMIVPKNSNWHYLSLFWREDTYISPRWDTYSYRHLKPQIRSPLSEKQQRRRERRAWAVIWHAACRFSLIIFLQISTSVSHNSSHNHIHWTLI